MRFIVYGVGAIGGVLAAKLVLSGADVAGIARGRQLDALKTNGVLLRTPDGEHRVTFPVAEHPRDLALRPDDVILLAIKSQDTAVALEALRDAGARDQAIVCAQNGVDNERAALRLFPNVYAMLVVMPATFIRPGEVAAFGGPHAGLFDVGRYPHGADAMTDTIVHALNAAGFAAFAQQDAMRSKYGKLLMNLGNVVDAAAGDAASGSDLMRRVRAEGETVLKAAGIAYADISPDNERRRRLMQPQPIAGAERVGSSSAQSLARGTGSIETDYLNGEIVLLGRLHGVPTPLNDGLCRLGRVLITEKRAPGSMDLAGIERFLVP
jgi:2-dehydropantoate 2-reductase